VGTRTSRRTKCAAKESPSSTVREGLDSPELDSTIGHESSTSTNIVAMLIMVAFTVVVILVSKSSGFRIVSEGTTRTYD
jgi:hypothetical protein